MSEVARHLHTNTRSVPAVERAEYLRKRGKASVRRWDINWVATDRIRAASSESDTRILVRHAAAKSRVQAEKRLNGQNWRGLYE